MGIWDQRERERKRKKKSVQAYIKSTLAGFINPVQPQYFNLGLQILICCAEQTADSRTMFPLSGLLSPAQNNQSCFAEHADTGRLIDILQIQH